MQSLSARDNRWFGTEPYLSAIIERWRSWRERNKTLADLTACGDAEVARMAADIGISPSELRVLAAHDGHDADLLRDRLAALHLDPEQIARRSPVVMREMQRLCTTCESKGRCANDLLHDPNDPAWRDYCPNAEMLSGLRPET
jgi:hypothetical protein